MPRTTLAAAPVGLQYYPDFIPEPEERELLVALERLEFAEVRMRGVVAKRRVAHFGWRYQYESWEITPGPPIPDFLLPLRDRLAALLKAAPASLAEALLTQYPPGAGIGWHRDAPMFGDVVGVSLLAGCRLRFQRGHGPARETYALALAPRSVYVLKGPARTVWQHSIPPVLNLRYSLTFRTLRR